MQVKEIHCGDYPYGGVKEFISPFPSEASQSAPPPLLDTVRPFFVQISNWERGTGRIQLGCVNLSCESWFKSLFSHTVALHKPLCLGLHPFWQYEDTDIPYVKAVRTVAIMFVKHFEHLGKM